MMPAEWETWRAAVRDAMPDGTMAAWARRLRIDPVVVQETIGEGRDPRRHPSVVLLLSIETRIMTVCDIFDALTASDRPYKKAMPVEKAIQILGWEAGDGMLDQDIVDLFAGSEVYQKVLDTDWREF